MTIIHCARACAHLASPPELLTAGMANAVTVEFVFTEDWDGLTKTAVFTNGKTTVDVLQPNWQGNTVTIPAEVLTTAGRYVRVGVYGTGADGVALPTIWADLGKVRPGAEPSGDVSTDPSLPVWAQLQALIGNLDDLTTKAKDNLVAAINEAAKTGSGGSGSIDLRVEDGYIQYSGDGGTTWENLIAIADLKGDDGATPNLQIGTVETLPAGSDATASMGGTAENPLLNLGIPKGADGSGGSGGTDLSLGMTSAAVGQLAKITAVDADGKPTAWAALNRDWTVKETYPLKDMTFPAAISVPQDSDSMLTIAGTDITADKNTNIKFTLSTAFAEGGYASRWSFTTTLNGHVWGSGVCMMLLRKRTGTNAFTMRRIGWAGGYTPTAWPESTQDGENGRLYYIINVNDATILNPDTTTNVILYTRDALC